MSTIIKAGAMPEASGRAVHHVAFNFNDMAAQAGQYLDQVRAQAANIIEDAKRQAETIRKNAEQAGHQAAMQAVDALMSEKIGEQMQTLMPALEKAIEEIQHSKQAWANHWQASAVKVATAIASRVIRREVSQTPQITIDLIAEALQLAAGSGEITIRLHPQDAETLGEQARLMARAMKDVATTTVTADPEISPGGCRVETKFGSIDQQFEAQLKRIEEELA